MAEVSELLTVSEAATLAGVSERTMRRWAAHGHVRTVGRGHRRRIPVSELSDRIGHTDRPSSDNRPPQSATAAVAIEAAHLADLVRELQATVTDLAGVAATWQVRADVLSVQLEQARGELRALKAPAPQTLPVSAIASNLGAQPDEPTTEPSEPPSPPVPDPISPSPNGSGWWRRWLAWAVIAL